MTNNKIQVIYRLSDRITLMWPSRPNDGDATNPQSFNVYWDNISTGGYATLIGSVSNGGSSKDPLGYRSYAKKVVFNIVPSQVPGWINDNANYVRLRPVINNVEQTAEAFVTIVPYSTNGMRLHYPELQTRAIIGFNKDENRFIPVSVDIDGKVITTT